MINEQSNVLARPISMEWGTNQNTGTDQCVVQFELLEGPDKGSTISAFLYFTQEKNSARSLESLRYCGCTFPEDDITSTAGFGTEDVRLTIEHEEYQGEMRAKVKWVNSSKPFAGAPMDAGKKASFRDRMKGVVAKLKKDQPDSDLPF